MEELDADAEVQVLLTTRSPTVLTSLVPLLDPRLDRVWRLVLSHGPHDGYIRPSQPATSR